MGMTGSSMNEIPEDMDPRQMTELIIGSILKSHYYMKDFQKEIASLSCQSEEFRMIEDQYKSHVPEFFKNIIYDSGMKLRISDPDTATQIILTSVESVIHETVFYGDGSRDEEVIKELSDMVLRYLFE